MYYLQSRYYNPEWGRFINADDTDTLTASPMDLTDKNLFSYCDNNPIMRVDEGGCFWNIVIGAAVGAIVSGTITVITNKMQGKAWNNGLGMSMLSGALSGGLAASGFGLAGQVIGNTIIGAASSTGQTLIEKEGEASAGDIATSALTGGIIGAISGRIGGAGTGSKTLTRMRKGLIKSIFKSGKPLRKAVKYYVSQTTKESIKCGLKSIPSIVKAGSPAFSYGWLSSFE